MQDSLEQVGVDFGYPFMLKSRTLAYDGRGNTRVATSGAAAAAVDALGGYEHGLYAERWSPFQKELAVMVARTATGSLRSYPVVETVHEDSILLLVEAPAAVAVNVAQRARKLAERAVACLDGAGIFGCGVMCLRSAMFLLLSRSRIDLARVIKIAW